LNITAIIGARTIFFLIEMIEFFVACNYQIENKFLNYRKRIKELVGL
jgi:hypothetical protein